jgi:predicted naringenin-chalcone synthase
LLNGPQAPTIKEVNKVFMQEGVKLAVQAAEKALADWGGKREDITHLGEWERVCKSGVCDPCLVWVSLGLDERERKRIQVEEREGALVREVIRRGDEERISSTE